MTDERIQRINELARKKREEGLTAEEQAEQDTLRREYIQSWREGVIQTLENTFLVDENGNKRPLPKKKK